MSRRPRESVLRAPYLKSIALMAERVPDARAYPFSIPAIAAEPFRIDFTKAVTILVGTNGSGKSTILEAIAQLCGFGQLGGNRNYAADRQDGDALGNYLRAGWLPKVGRGFYTRAETFSGFVGQVDGFDANEFYGGRSLAERSHGEAYLEIFRNRVQGKGVFLFDEPEAALSPARQIDFLKLVKAAESGGEAQFIMATHSPLLMAYPGATVLHLTDFGILERPFELTEHFRVLREFYLDPKSFMDGIFTD
jgi:predicted ATPase